MQKYYLIFQKKNPLKETKIFQNIITLELLISNFNTSQKISSFKHPHVKIRPIIIIIIIIT